MLKRINRLDHHQKIFSYSNWENIKSILDGTIKHKFSPILTLDLTEKCNYFCEYCIDGKNTNKDTARSLDWPFLKNILKDIKDMGCRGIEITGGGEPTLYEHFEDFILLATELGFHLSLITNGSRLYPHKEAIKKSAFDWIRVSLDAATATTHQQVHSLKQNIFDNIVLAVEQIAASKVVGISFIISEKNCAEIYYAAELAQNIGAQYIEFKPKIGINNKFDTKFNVDYVIQQLHQCKDLEQDSFHVIITQSLIGLLETSDIVYPKQDKQYHRCYSCFFRIVLTPSGIYPCSYYRRSRYRMNQFNTVHEIIQARNELISCIDPAVSCGEYCARDSTNNIIDKITNLPEDYAFLIDNMGWPIDYGDDWLWL